MKINQSPTIYVTTHKKLGSYAFLSEKKAKEFLEKNKENFKKHSIDLDEIKIEPCKIAETVFAEAYIEKFPEYLV